MDYETARLAQYKLKGILIFSSSYIKKGWDKRMLAEVKNEPLINMFD
ncbi:hypothetical protein [Priestia megaterium]|nr:hypothetical protein [Priestia megaterium]